MKPITDELKINELLARGAEEVIIAADLRKKLASGEKLRVKFGADPTSPDLHLGHSVPLRKLRQFQDLGHRVVLIIGDYTAKVGDPSGKSKTRPMLSDKEIKQNAKTYLEQAGKILDIKKCEIVYNSGWFKKMNFGEIIQLAARFTVARMIERDDFSKRLKEGADIGMHELLYPIMQAYDSIQVRADVEIGGTDQKFNLLAGRDLQRKLGTVEQNILTVPLLVGLDGDKKMSKSLGNYVGLSDIPHDMYGKIMSIPDPLIVSYFTLLTDLPTDELENINRQLKDEKTNPRDLKMRLAREIVKMYHGAEDASRAENDFKQVFQRREAPTEIPKHKVSSPSANLIDILLEVGFAESRGEARRLIEQGGVKVNEEVVKDIAVAVKISDRGTLLQKGKRSFVKLIK
ncbi:MAG: tyrosine--tRNA ligase [Patescibacteria group bacterium]